MKKILLLGLAAAFLMAAGSALAQEIIPMNFDNQYHTGTDWYGGPDGGVETGTYSGSINHVSVGHPGDAYQGMICDDYYDHIYPNQPWTAAAYQVSSLNSGNIANTLYGGATWSNVVGTWTGYAGAVEGYQALAYLVNQMYQTNDPGMQSSISQAIWYLTSVANGHSQSAWEGYLGSGSEAWTLVQYVETHDLPLLSTYTSLWLYTQPFVPAGQQEMWGQVPVPEGGTAALYLLLAGLACAGAVWQSRGMARLEGRA